MKIDTLAFVQHLLASQHPPAVFHPHAPVLLPVIISAVSDPFYKISSEALLVLESLVKVLRPLDQPSNFNFQPYTSKVGWSFLREVTKGMFYQFYSLVGTTNQWLIIFSKI
jgi:cullin-associated NEDD8-dissociated protein 1